MLGHIAWHMSFFHCGEYPTHEDISKTRFANSQRNWFGFWNNYIIVIIIIIINLVEIHM